MRACRAGPLLARTRQRIGFARDGRARFAAKTPAPLEGLRGPNSKFKLSLDEALYLAKEAGIWTTRERQLQMVRSPPFSPTERPFLIEDFFEVADQDDEPVQDGEPKSGTDPPEEPKSGTDPPFSTSIHNAIQKYFRPSQLSKFSHNSEEWLSWSEGRGTRKRASAHVVICRGSGIFKVNGESDMFARWPHIYHRIDVCQPFKLTGTAGIYDVFAEVSGGGIGGQAGATRLAVSRALLRANPACHDALQRGFCLLEDARQRMSKMPGKARSRKGFPWTKR